MFLLSTSSFPSLSSALTVGALVSTGVAVAAAWVQTRRLAESHRAREELEKSSRVLEEERHVLELIARGASLKEVLNALTKAIERMAPNCFCTILLLDDQRRRLLGGSGGSLPVEYMQAVSGLEIGPNVGACGTAAYRNETTVVEDIATDFRFAPVKHFVIWFAVLLERADTRLQQTRLGNVCDVSPAARQAA